MDEISLSVKRLENEFNHIYENAIKENNFKKKKEKIDSMRLLMYDMNAIKEEPDNVNNIHISKIVFEKQINMAEKIF